MTLVLTKVTAQGSLDEGFGEGGFVDLEDFEAAFRAPRIIHELESGALLVIRSGTGDDGPEFARLHPDGSLDEEFGDGGRKRFTASELKSGPWTERLYDHLVDRDPDTGFTYAMRLNGTIWRLYRFTDEGEVDWSFNGGKGFVEAEGWEPRSLVATGGYVYVAEANTTLHRFGDKGRDESFGEGGKVLNERPSPYDTFSSVVLHSAGKGRVVLQDRGYLSFLNAEGALDTSVWPDGRTKIKFQSVLVEPGATKILLWEDDLTDAAYYVKRMGPEGGVGQLGFGYEQNISGVAVGRASYYAIADQVVPEEHRRNLVISKFHRGSTP